jgi:cytochrome c oxidase cbb3-type subunit 3
MKSAEHKSMWGGAATAAAAIAWLAAGCSASDDAAAPQSTQPAASAAELKASSQAFENAQVEDLVSNPAAISLASQLFAAHCASCHGDGAGARAPDIAAGHFNYGVDESSIRATITAGRHFQMPGLGYRLGPTSLGELTAFVQSLGSNAPLSSFEEGGKELFAKNCASCHGEDGRGSTALGAPNLADDYWINGSSMMNIRLAITRGIEAECPPHGDQLSPAEVNLLTAYVLERLGS